MLVLVKVVSVVVVRVVMLVVETMVTALDEKSWRTVVNTVTKSLSFAVQSGWLPSVPKSFAEPGAFVESPLRLVLVISLRRSPKTNKQFPG